MADKWTALREAFAGGGIQPEQLAKFLQMGGTLDHPAEIMQIMQGSMGLQQLQDQNKLQPLRMQLIQGMSDQMGQPMQNPYMNTPTALPNLPGMGQGGMGSTPAGPSGMAMPDFSNLRSALAGTFGGGGAGGGGDAGGGDAFSFGDPYVPDVNPDEKPDDQKPRDEYEDDQEEDEYDRDGNLILK